MTRSLRNYCCFALVAIAISCDKGIEDHPFVPVETKETSGTSLINYHIVVDGKQYWPVDTLKGNYHIFVPAGKDLRHVVASFEDNAKSIIVDEVPQISGVTTNDFSDYQTGVRYEVMSDLGGVRCYTVYVYETKLPIIAINTKDEDPIEDKINWKDASIKIVLPNGTIEYEDSTFIRGRGNITWTAYPKKPYALKLHIKSEILGMPKHKRWVLLALYRGIIGNPIMYEASRRAPGIEWVPRDAFVELVLNGKHLGLYLLCEQVKIDKNRVNITELKKGDVAYPNISGGYLLEYDELFDEEYKFKSQYFDMPIQLKAPDENVPSEQIEYITNYINRLELELKKIGTSETSHYEDFLDIDNFADYWMTLELIGNYEAFKPRSVKMYKGRDGIDSPSGTVSKLKAGPLWDQELLQVYQKFNTKDAWYFKYLFKDEKFVKAVKTRWPIIRGNILGNSNHISLLDYLSNIVDQIRISSDRDFFYWNNFWNGAYIQLDSQVQEFQDGFLPKVFWMDEQINSLTVNN